MTKTTRSSGEGVFAVLPLRDIVVFPHMIVPLFVGREKSIKALEEVMGAEKQILLATQKNAADDDPEPDAIYEIGTLANVLQLLKLPDGTVKVLVEGATRAQITGFTDRAEFHEANAAGLTEPEEEEIEVEALARSVVADFENYVKLNKNLARGCRRGKPDRRLFQARRHGRLASGNQDPREAGNARHALRARAA